MPCPCAPPTPPLRRVRYPTRLPQGPHLGHSVGCVRPPPPAAPQWPRQHACNPICLSLPLKLPALRPAHHPMRLHQRPMPFRLARPFRPLRPAINLTPLIRHLIPLHRPVRPRHRPAVGCAWPPPRQRQPCRHRARNHLNPSHWPPRRHRVKAPLLPPWRRPSRPRLSLRAPPP